jgi:RNA polymerase sigma factor (sigma-70 family)
MGMPMAGGAPIGLVGANPIVAGDEAADATNEAGAFEQFYRGQADRVYRALLATIGDLHLAREATDEAMARAYARWRRVSELDNPGGWAYRVGLNWATSRWRKLRREQAVNGDQHLNHPGHPVVDPPDAEALAALAALRQLPTPNRAVVVCRVLLDLSTTQTAELLGVSEGTVKSRLSRSLAGLRAALAQEDAR